MKLRYEDDIERLRPPPSSVEKQAESEHAVDEFDPETDSLVAQYYGDVRQYELLNRAQETALWERIEYLKKRVLRSLYRAAVCLPTLQKLWQQVQEGELELNQIVADTASVGDSVHDQNVRFEAAIQSLKELARCLQHLKTRKRLRGPNRIQTWRDMRHVHADLWQQWIGACEALQLQPSVHDELRCAMEAALRDQPDDRALRVAYRAWKRAHRDLEDAKAKMLRANLRLVIYVAKRYRSDDVPLLDLIQEGNIGLMRALEKFEPSRGLKFVTYAHWWVRQAIGRAVIEQRRAVRLPSHVVERKNKLRTTHTKLWQVHKREPTIQELSAELGWTPQEVEQLQDAGQVMIRLHEPVSEDGQQLGESMADERSPDPDVTIEQHDLQQRVADCLSDLSEREAQILRLRFGLDADHAHTLKEIGEIYGLSRERIRQLETLALKKLRDSNRGASLADFVDVT